MSPDEILSELLALYNGVQDEWHTDPDTTRAELEDAYEHALALMDCLDTLARDGDMPVEWAR